MVYLVSHDRPMHELLDPQFKDIERTYASEFAGMAREEVAVGALCRARERLVELIRRRLDADEKQFLLSMKEGEPDWALLGIAHLRELPALQWKLTNIRKMDSVRRRLALKKLEAVLAL